MKKLSQLGFAVILNALISCLLYADSSQVAIIHANIYTQTESGLIKDGTVLIEDGVVKTLGKTVKIPAGTKVVDAKGGSITPGLFNAVTHIGIEEVSAIRATDDFQTKDNQITASLVVADAFNPRSVIIPQNRIHGLTHALVFPESGSKLVAGQVALVNLSARPGTSVINDSVAIAINLGEQGKKLAGGSRAAAFRQLKTLLNDVKDYISHKNAFNQRQRRNYSASQDDLEALIPVVKGLKPVIISIHRASDIEHLIPLAKSYGLKVILSGVEEGWMVADKIAAADMAVIIDPSYNLPGSYEKLGARLENAAMMAKAGVKLIFTGIGFRNTHNAYLVRQAAGIAVSYGLPKQQAIAAITRNPMQLFENSTRVGIISPGEKADLVLWQGDPLELTSEAQMVWVDGTIVPMVSRATRLRDRYYQRLLK